MNTKNISFTKNKKEITHNQSSSFQDRLSKLSPFQRPILPSSFYPFHCKKETLEEKRNPMTSVDSETMPSSPEKNTGLPVVCQQCGAHIEIRNAL
ncbi:MAG: hypothetical protein KJ737_03530 [Proteobacteria bacterium]|nr:hypothetical protein [Pseudomonadota bacterium]